MSPETFPQANMVIAKDQPQYTPLPACNKDGVVTSFWRFSDAERDNIARGIVPGVYVSQCTFGGPLQPVAVDTEFNPPVLPKPVELSSPPMLPEPVEGKTEFTATAGVERLAKCLGLSGPLLFAMDNESIEGKTLCHFVRLETVAFDDGSEAPEMTAVAPNLDPRLDFLSEMFTESAGDAVLNLMKALNMTADALDRSLPTTHPKMRPAVAQICKVAALTLQKYSATK